MLRFSAYCVFILSFVSRICEPEQFKFKNGTLAALDSHVTKINSTGTDLIDGEYGQERFCQDFLLLARLFAFIIWTDSWDLDRIRGHPWMSTTNQKELKVLIHEVPREGSTIRYCRFCQCNIWNLHIQCNEGHGSHQPYTLCIDCFALGRGCLHRATSLVSFHQLFPLEDAIQTYKRSAMIWNSYTGLKSVQGHQLLSLDWKDE